MEAFLVEWGTEIILSVVIAMLTYFFKKSDKEKDAQMAHYQQLLEEERNGKIENMIEVQLQPIYDELEEIRKRVFSLQDHHEEDVKHIECEHIEDLKKINDNISLIISSYKYRLVELCKGLLAQGFMYQYQYDHLNEFYNLYTRLGGNGQAKQYFDKVCSTLTIKPNPADHHIV